MFDHIVSHRLSTLICEHRLLFNKIDVVPETKVEPAVEKKPDVAAGAPTIEAAIEPPPVKGIIDANLQNAEQRVDAKLDARQQNQGRRVDLLKKITEPPQPLNAQPAVSAEQMQAVQQTAEKLAQSAPNATVEQKKTFLGQVQKTVTDVYQDFRTGSNWKKVGYITTGVVGLLAVRWLWNSIRNTIVGTDEKEGAISKTLGWGLSLAGAAAGVLGLKVAFNFVNDPLGFKKAMDSAGNPDNSKEPRIGDRLGLPGLDTAIDAAGAAGNLGLGAMAAGTEQGKNALPIGADVARLAESFNALLLSDKLPEAFALFVANGCILAKDTTGFVLNIGGKQWKLAKELHEKFVKYCGLEEKAGNVLFVYGEFGATYLMSKATWQLILTGKLRIPSRMTALRLLASPIMLARDTMSGMLTIATPNGRKLLALQLKRYGLAPLFQSVMDYRDALSGDPQRFARAIEKWARLKEAENIVALNQEGFLKGLSSRQALEGITREKNLLLQRLQKGLAKFKGRTDLPEVIQKLMMKGELKEMHKFEEYLDATRNELKLGSAVADDAIDMATAGAKGSATELADDVIGDADDAVKKTPVAKAPPASGVIDDIASEADDVLSKLKGRASNFVDALEASKLDPADKLRRAHSYTQLLEKYGDEAADLLSDSEFIEAFVSHGDHPLLRKLILSRAANGAEGLEAGIRSFAKWSKRLNFTLKGGKYFLRGLGVVGSGFEIGQGIMSLSEAYQLTQQLEKLEAAGLDVEKDVQLAAVSTMRNWKAVAGVAGVAGGAVGLIGSLPFVAAGVGACGPVALVMTPIILAKAGYEIRQAELETFKTPEEQLTYLFELIQNKSPVESLRDEEGLSLAEYFDISTGYLKIGSQGLSNRASTREWLHAHMRQQEWREKVMRVIVTRALMARGINLPTRTVQIGKEQKQIANIDSVYPLIENYIRISLFSETGEKGNAWGMRLGEVEDKDLEHILNEAIDLAEQKLLVEQLQKSAPNSPERVTYADRETFLGTKFDKTKASDFANADVFRPLRESTIEPIAPYRWERWFGSEKAKLYDGYRLRSKKESEQWEKQINKFRTKIWSSEGSSSAA